MQSSEKMQIQQQQQKQSWQQQQQQYAGPALNAQECHAFCSWYSHYQHHYYHQHLAMVAVAAAAAAQAADYYYGGPPRAKRRKVSNDEPSSNTSSSTRLLRSRGRVTFKPYTDDLLEGDENEMEDGAAGCGSIGHPRRKSEACDQLSPRSPGEPDYGGTRRRKGAGGATKEVGTRCERGYLQMRRSATAAVEKKRKTTVADLLPEVLSHTFQFLDVQSKGRVASVRNKMLLLLSFA